MKNLILLTAAAIGIQFTASAQVSAPQASPFAKVEQKVGLTDVTVLYSRPSKRDRVVFGEVVPFDQVWRTGANENTKITFSDATVYGKDTLPAGTYALYTKPGKDSWDVIFYKDYSNWGTPETWDDSKVALKVSAPVRRLTDGYETFTIAVNPMETAGGNLTLSWDKTQVVVPFAVPTEAKVMASIKKVMAGPSGNDYYSAANYYLTTKKDMKQALEWINKAVEMRPEAYWMLRTKSLIQVELGDKKGAIETAKKGVVVAEKGENPEYVKIFNNSVTEWSK